MKSILGLVVLALVLPAGAARAQEGKTYAPGPFDQLIISGQAKVELTQGDKDQVFVAGDAATQKNVVVLLKNGKMIIETEDDWKFWNRAPVQMRIQMRDIKRLIISGATDISALKPLKADALRIDISGQGLVKLGELTANQLRFDISGAGDGDLAGKVEDLQLRVSGKGKFIADKLRSVRADVRISGIGSADVWATDELRVAVSGIGTVNYWGLPRVMQRQASGMADVNAKGDKR